MLIGSLVVIFRHSGLRKASFGKITVRPKTGSSQSSNSYLTPASDRLYISPRLNRVSVSSLQFLPKRAILKCYLKLSLYDRWRHQDTGIRNMRLVSNRFKSANHRIATVSSSKTQPASPCGILRKICNFAGATHVCK